MANTDLYSLDGRQVGKVELPQIFSIEVKPWLISRAAVAEQSRRMQPQGHFVLAGMQTTAAYYGAMMSWRTGRHVGKAIRPREKLGGGALGKIRRIPSSVKGKRAHPHLIEKDIHETINDGEYRRAVASAVAATASRDGVPSGTSVSLPVVVSNDIESVSKTKAVLALFKGLKILDYALSSGTRARKGVRRSSIQRLKKHKILMVVNADKGIVKAARNIPSVEVSTTSQLSIGKLAPGGAGRVLVIWSEDAVKGVTEAINRLSLR